MCGIFGIITTKPRKLDLRAFCVLGVNNDSRGGDSCGIFIDKKYEYGVNGSKLFYSFFPKSKVLNNVKKCQVALGHCRKASVGAINEANAQPVVIKDELGNVQFALIHNGTIINYQEMARKYIPEIDIKDMTDSQVMARIFYHTGYDVLGEYIGAGAFVMVDYRSGEPEVFFFKGESKNSKYSVTTTIERPLFCTYDDSEFIFSSIMDYLKALRPEREVLTINPNKLLQLKDGKLYVINKYDRTQLWQTKSHNDFNSYNNYNAYNRDSGNLLLGLGKRYWDDVVEMDSDGVYMIGDDRAHGLFWVDAMGNVEHKKKANTIQVAFWKGVLLKNIHCYSFLAKFAKDMNSTPEDVLKSLPDLVHFLSPCACWRNPNGKWVTSDTPTTNFLYTGNAIFPFTTEEVYFKAGKLDWFCEGITYREALTDLQLSADYIVDSDAICELY